MSESKVLIYLTTEEFENYLNGNSANCYSYSMTHTAIQMIVPLSKLTVVKHEERFTEFILHH